MSGSQGYIIIGVLMLILSDLRELVPRGERTAMRDISSIAWFVLGAIYFIAGSWGAGGTL